MYVTCKHHVKCHLRNTWNKFLRIEKKSRQNATRNENKWRYSIGILWTTKIIRKSERPTKKWIGTLEVEKNLSNFDITMMLITEHCKFFILNGNTRTEVLGSDFAYLKPNGAFVCTKNTVLFWRDHMTRMECWIYL